MRGLAVGIPARDEAADIEACLDAVLSAASAVTVPVALVVVADSCRDATAEVARRCLADSAANGVVGAVVEAAPGGVGAARDLACRTALALLGPDDPVTCWVATTDADSTVPPGWLAAQVDAAAHGAHGLAGLVRLAGADDADLVRRYASHVGPPRPGHAHVHGANLGVRADWWLRAGGFPAVASGEDHDLWATLRSLGARLDAVSEHPVTTSARLAGRAPAGFAALLAEIAGSRGVEITRSRKDSGPPRVGAVR